MTVALLIDAPSAGTPGPYAPVITTVDVHLAALEMLPAGCSALLDDGESARAAAYRFADDRRRFVLGAVLLRAAVADALGVRPHDVAVDRACATCGAPHGRPVIAGAGIHVSVAHSGDCVAVAVTVAGPVGVDVEVVDGRSAGDLRELVGVVCAQEEQPFVVAPEDFHTYWTRKEAVLKATGDGLRSPMSEVVVTAPDLEPRLVALARREPPPCRMFDLPTRPGYRGSVAVMTRLQIDLSVRDAAAVLAHA